MKKIASIAVYILIEESSERPVGGLHTLLCLSKLFYTSGKPTINQIYKLGYHEAHKLFFLLYYAKKMVFLDFSYMIL